MNDETAKETAKAAKEIAITGRVAIEHLGPWFGRVIGEPTSELVGMMTDRLKFARAKRVVLLMQRFDQFLLEQGITDPPPIPAKFAIPIIEHASLEDDDVLFELWSNLLLSEVDPEVSQGIRAAFLGIIQQLDPLDAQIIGLIYRDTAKLREASFSHVIHTGSLKAVVREKFGEEISENDMNVSIDNLLRLRCVETQMEAKQIVTHDAHTGRSQSHIVSLDHGADRLALTELGIAFVEACFRPNLDVDVSTTKD